MQLHFYQVRYFLALARTLNFTRAAEQCNVTQPTLTKAVQKLEQELGGALIHRERQLTQLTELGKMILPRWRKYLRPRRRYGFRRKVTKRRQSPRSRSSWCRQSPPHSSRRAIDAYRKTGHFPDGAVLVTHPGTRCGRRVGMVRDSTRTSRSRPPRRTTIPITRDAMCRPRPPTGFS
jgi:Bacterial regulatory helix-turn-helix protein, lysR family